MADEQEFFVGQKAFIEKDGQVLVLLDEFGVDFPGGKIQEGEDNLAEALQREVTEETQLQITIGSPFITWHSTVKKNKNPNNIGKKTFLVGYLCQYVSGEVTLSDEHDSYRWVNKSNYKELADNSSHFQALEKYFSFSHDTD